MILGEIVIDKKFHENTLIKQISEKDIVNIKDDIIFNGLPTLFIGWNDVSKVYNNEINICNKKIKKDVYWTFAPDERLQDFNENIIKFIDNLYEDFIYGIKYKFIDPIIEKLKNSNEIVSIASNSVFDTTYITEDFIYSYNHIDKTIYGLDLEYFKFMKYSTNKIIKNITENSKNVYVEDYTLESGVYQKYKNFLNKDFDKKYLVYLLYKEK